MLFVVDVGSDKREVDIGKVPQMDLYIDGFIYSLRLQPTL